MDIKDSIGDVIEDPEIKILQEKMNIVNQDNNTKRKKNETDNQQKKKLNNIIRIIEEGLKMINRNIMEKMMKKNLKDKKDKE